MIALKSLNFSPTGGVDTQDAPNTVTGRESQECAFSDAFDSAQPNKQEHVGINSDSQGHEQGTSAEPLKKGPRERDIKKIDLPPLVDDFLEETKGLPLGSKYNPELFAEKHNISTAVVTKDVYHAALIKGYPPLEFVSGSTAKDIVYVNDIGLIVIGKTKHNFPAKTHFTISSDDGGLLLTPLT